MIGLILGAWLYSRHGWQAIWTCTAIMSVLELSTTIWPGWPVHLAYVLGQMTRDAVIWIGGAA